jgi:hypothetical protein
MSKIISAFSTLNMLIGNPETLNIDQTFDQPTPVVQIASNPSEKTQSSILDFRSKESSKFEIPTESDIIESQPNPDKVYSNKEEIFRILGFGNSAKYGPVEMYMFQAGKYYFRIHHKNSPQIYSTFEFQPIYSLESVQIITVRSIDSKTGKFVSTIMRINNSTNQFPLK